MLGATSYCSMYTCSTTSRISWSVDPKRALTKGCCGKKPGLTSSPLPAEELWVLRLLPWQFLVMDGVGEGKLGIITTFCRSDQAKVEPLDALLTLVQWDWPDPGVVVVKVFTNSPHLPWWSFGSPYLDVTTLSAGTLTTQFPLAQMCLCRLLPYSPTQVILPWQTEGDGLKIYPILMETLWESSEEEHHLSPFTTVISPHCLLQFQ